MRLKNINIDERSSTFTNEKQKKCLKEMSDSVNQLGEVFDNMINFETFVLQGIHNELSVLIGIREDKDTIVKEQGMKVYLDEYFTPSVYEVEEKIQQIVKDWDTAEDRKSTEEIKQTIILLKEIANVLNNIEANFKSLNIIHDLIDEFGYFQICKVIFAGDIVDRINVLIRLKGDMEKIFSPAKVDEPKTPIERRKKLTIDDL